MVSLEQVKLLETKVIKTIEYVKKVTEENKSLKRKLDSYQQRIDELEAQTKRFREDQSRIEEKILSSLDLLNQFEDALENVITQENPNPLVSEAGEKEKSEDENSASLPPGNEPEISDEPPSLREEAGDSGLPPEDSSNTEPSESTEQAGPRNPDNELDIF